MTIKRVSVAIPLARLDDIEMAAELIADRPRPDLSSPEQRRAFQPVDDAISHVRASAAGIRASRAARRRPYTVTAMSAAHLETLHRSLLNLRHGTDIERATASRVIAYLDNLRARLGLPALGGLSIATVGEDLELRAEDRIARVPRGVWPREWNAEAPDPALEDAIVDWLRAHPAGSIVELDIDTIRKLMD